MKMGHVQRLERFAGRRDEPRGRALRATAAVHGISNNRNRPARCTAALAAYQRPSVHTQSSSQAATAVRLRWRKRKRRRAIALPMRTMRVPQRFLQTRTSPRAAASGEKSISSMLARGRGGNGRRRFAALSILHFSRHGYSRSEFSSEDATDGGGISLVFHCGTSENRPPPYIGFRNGNEWDLPPARRRRVE